MSPINDFFDIPTDRIAAIKLEKLIGRDPQFLPDDVRKFALRIARRLEPFEAYSGLIDWGCHRDVVDLFSLLIFNGVFGEELVADVARLAGRMHVSVLRHLSKFALGTVSERAFDNFCVLFGDAFEKQVLAPIMADGRRLAYLCLSEGILKFRAHSIQTAVEAIGIDQTFHRMRMLTEPGARLLESHQRDLYEAGWWAVVDWLSNAPDPDEIMSQEQFTDAAAVLSETEFADLREPIQVPLPRVFESFPQATCYMTILPGLVFTGLIDFVLRWSPDNSVNWTLSRLGGRFMSRTSLLLPFDAPFRHYDKMRSYEYLCRASVAAVLEALHVGTLCEDIDAGGDDLAIRLELSRLSRLIDTLPATILPTVGIPEEALPMTLLVAASPLAQVANGGFDDACAMGTGRRKRRSLPSHRPRVLGWRKIMAGLSRWGVAIDITTTHPKLTYGGKTAGFLNRHPGEDPAFNRRVLEQTLATLGIDPDAFYRSL